jgi:hypothetical protein
VVLSTNSIAVRGVASTVVSSLRVAHFGECGQRDGVAVVIREPLEVHAARVDPPDRGPVARGSAQRRAVSGQGCVDGLRAIEFDHGWSASAAFTRSATV